MQSRTLVSMQRRKTRDVFVGGVGVGSNFPIRLQSMTTSKTADVDAVVSEIQELADAGCEIVRVTVQGKKEAAACQFIKERLVKDGYTIPLVADIHFYPPAAMQVVEFVDKVRINPGNFADRRATFREVGYQENELERIEAVFAPLVLKCKALQKPIRIGTNHGSLSDRIMTRYGDSPLGMVESAFEYARIARKYDFHDLFFSMKASNPVVMVEAYRLMVKKMDEEGWDYPLHLGVTEAGYGIDGRIKSAAGIGALLQDGIGDTIRVSLAEDPVKEILPCRVLKELAEQFAQRATFARVTEKPHSTLPLGEVFTEDTWDTRGDVKVVHPLAARDTYQSGERGYVVVKDRYEGDAERVALQAGYFMGPALLDGVAHGICIDADLDKATLEQIGNSLVQGCRLKMTKTEYIACPSCGRTLFDLQAVTRQIEAKTAHLPGVKIAVMGCIVNGPGEMADADFGYVGSKTGMVDLYVGKTCVERNIPQERSVDALITLLKKEGVWVTPSETLEETDSTAALHFQTF